MPKLHLCRPDSDAIAFPVHAKQTSHTRSQPDNLKAVEESSRAAAEVRNTLALANTISLRMEDLAREYDCLGYFDSDDDKPKAA